MPGYTLKRIDEMADLHHGSVTLAGAELGVESFGMQLLEFPPGFADYPEHDHAEDRMEEVYVVLDGSGEFDVDGERVAVDPSRMISIAPDARRKLTPGREGIRVLAIGCTSGRPYERPDAFRLEVRS